MGTFKTAALSVMLALQAGCVANESKDSMKPAVLTQSSVATTKVLNATVSRALNGARVRLARDVLTKSSELKVERMAKGTASQPGLNGSLMGKPLVYQFSLRVATSGNCYLIYQKNGQKYSLESVSCRAL